MQTKLTKNQVKVLAMIGMDEDQQIIMDRCVETYGLHRGTLQALYMRDLIVLNNENEAFITDLGCDTLQEIFDSIL